MREKSYDNKFFPTVLKGTAMAVIVTLIGVLVFAFIVKTAYLSSSVIKAVNQFIKVISIFLGCFIFVKGEKGLIKGGLIGMFSAVIVYLIFALMGGGASLSGLVLIDLIFQIIVGLISGVIAVNFRK